MLRDTVLDRAKSPDEQVGSLDVIQSPHEEHDFRRIQTMLRTKGFGRTILQVVVADPVGDHHNTIGAHPVRLHFRNFTVSDRDTIVGISYNAPPDNGIVEFLDQLRTPVDWQRARRTDNVWFAGTPQIPVNEGIQDGPVPHDVDDIRASDDVPDLPQTTPREIESSPRARAGENFDTRNLTGILLRQPDIGRQNAAFDTGSGGVAAQLIVFLCLSTTGNGIQGRPDIQYSHD